MNTQTTSPDSFLDFNTLTFTKERYRSVSELALDLPAPNIESAIDEMTHRMRIELGREILTDKVASSTYTTEVRYPESFRYRHQSKWWMKPILKLFPIRYASKEVGWTLSKSYRFPEFDTSVYPKHLGHITMHEEVNPVFYPPS